MHPRTALHTERLVLRKLTRDDIPAIVAGLNDFAVSQWLTVVPYPYGETDAADFVVYLDQGGRFDGYGLTRDGGPVIGVVGIDTSLGYWLARAHHGRGYMTEAARALVGHWFGVTGAAHLTSGYFTGNAASAGVLGKLGFRPAGAETVTSRARGGKVTLRKMALSRADWETVHGH